MNKVAVGALFVSSDTSRVLLNLRAPEKSHSLRWSLFGGMCEEGEVPIVALKRELNEEIGFDPDITKVYPYDIFEASDGHFRFYTFVCVVKEEFNPEINYEAVGYAWVKLGHWPKPLHSGVTKTFCKSNSIDKLNLILDQHR